MAMLAIYEKLERHNAISHCFHCFLLNVGFTFQEYL